MSEEYRIDKVTNLSGESEHIYKKDIKASFNVESCGGAGCGLFGLMPTMLRRLTHNHQMYTEMNSIRSKVVVPSSSR